MPRIMFPQHKRGRAGIECFEGTILEHARRLGVQLPSECGGRGQCRRCVVRVEHGAEALSEKTSAERAAALAEGERLACQARVLRSADIRVFVKAAGPYAILATSESRPVALAPRTYRSGDSVILNTPHGEETLGRYRGGIFGLAVDVGTTTVVSALVDLESGATIATLADPNPQTAYGDDVISRIGYTRDHEGGLAELQAAVINSLNDALVEWERSNRQVSNQVYDVVVVGNPTMRDIFFGVDVSSLGVIPFQPKSTKAIMASAAALELRVNQAARVYGGPLIGGHAGADAVADVLASGIHTCSEPSMVVDIGTNGEVVVGNQDRMLAASCAAGGAYEGAAVGCGVGALQGAISNIAIRDGHLRYQTIGGKAPIGLCGSGLIDLLAELLRTGMMNRAGKLATPNRQFPIDGNAGLVLTQEDVNNLMVARAGMSLDQVALIARWGIAPTDLQHVFLAGAFGNYVSAENAARIGLLPDLPDRIVRLGNGALEGARLMLLSQDKKREAETVARKIQHVRPNEDSEFFDALVDRMCFQAWG
ncbi:MAG: DUF4445 domain-containing protein [Armatimonadota bacterium]|nr:MAG: DUF4445 domain-containing protein [Armatimonadota bacterium]